MRQKNIQDLLADLVSPPNPIKKVDFISDNFPVLGLYQDIRPSTDDWQDSAHNSQNAFVANVADENISSALMKVSGGVISILAYQDSTNLKALHFLDDGLFSEYYIDSAGQGTVWTGDPLPTGVIFSMHWDETNQLLYYCPADAPNDSVYIFDYVNLTNTRKQFAGTSNLRYLAYDAIDNKLIVGSVGSTACAFVVYDITGDTHVVYGSNTANYTGATLPASSIGAEPQVINGELWLARGSTIATADNGLYRFNLTTLVCTKFLAAQGLADDKPNKLQANGIYLYVGYFNTVTATPISRFKTDDQTVVHYGNATANYTGDLIPTQSLSVLRVDVANQILICNTSTVIWTAKIDGSFNLTNVAVHTAILGYTAPSAFTGLTFRGSQLIGADLKPLLYFSAPGGASGPGIQAIKYWDTECPIKVTFDQDGLKIISSDVKVFGPNSAVPKSYIDSIEPVLPVPQVLDKDMIPIATSGDESSTNLTISATPKGFIMVVVDGIAFRVGNGVTTKDCYFSGNGGVTARGYSSIVAGDTLYWNGIIAGADLAPTNSVDFYYI